MESEVFLLGQWKDYDELEETFSMPELLATLEAYRKMKWRDYRFQAAMQGVSLPEDADGKEVTSFEDVQKRALIRAQGGDPELNDVAQLRGAVAEHEGFGVEMEGGMRYQVE